MTTTHETTLRRPLRLWPGVIFAALIVLVRFVMPLILPDRAIYGVLGSLAAALAIVVWWMFFSRAPWSERLGAIALMVLATIALKRVVHPSIATGMMGMMLFIYAVPSTLSLALVGWAVASRRFSAGLRWATLVVAVLAGCGVWMLLRTDGVTGDGVAQLAWRWTKTAEQQLLEQGAPALISPAPVLANVSKPPAASPLDEAAVRDPPGPGTAAAAAGRVDTASMARERSGPDPGRVEWPGFRGAGRDSIIRGVRIETDWSASPPVALWRRPIGPGWSSFAVRGDLLYTQEQRGEHEIVTSYKVSTGEPVWQHRDAVRFWESNAGAGPRATPTLRNGRVYTFGATGIVNALDAGTGAVVWSRNAAADTGVEIPDWGFASSPLVIDDIVIIAASGRLVAYAAATGEPRWFGPTGGAGYSSPHLATIDGVAQVLLLRGSRTISVAPADGALLWEHAWESGVGIVQPALAASGDVLITTGDAMGGVGMRRIAVARGPGGWTAEERWTSRGLKPYFNDFVVHEGHAYGFDGSILSCIDVADGTRKWKGGRYGRGQLVLLADQDLLLVLSEDGELALVGATADEFKELARVQALEGKTWNHPVLAGSVLLVRNGQEMAAFRLSVADR